MAELPPRVVAALRTLAIEAVDVEPIIGAVPWLAKQRTFFVTTTTGDRLKVRRFRDHAYAQRACDLATAVGDPRLPPPIALVGGVMVERWVEGTVLSAMTVERAHVDDARDLLDAVHRCRGLTAERLPQVRRTAPLGAATAARTAAAVAGGLLTRAEGTRLTRLLDGLPPTAAWGVTHNDLCAENIVVTASGALRVIDNEHVMRGFHAYDLARAWYRWPLPEWGQRRFAHASDDETGAWRVAATMRGVDVRRRTGAPVDHAVAIARRLVAT